MNNIYFDRFYEIAKDILKILKFDSYDMYVKESEIEFRIIKDGKLIFLKVKKYELSKCKAMNISVNLNDGNGTYYKVVYLRTELSTGKITDASIKDKGDYFNMSLTQNMIFTFEEIEELRKYFHTLNNEEVSISLDGQVWGEL